MNNLTLSIGQYLKMDSWIHRLDPRFKIIAVVALMIAIFLLPNFYFVLGSVGVLLLIILSAKIPIRYVLKGLKPILILSLFSFFLQLIYTNTGKLLFSLPANFSVYHILIIVFLIAFYVVVSRFIRYKLLLLLLVLLSVFLSIFYIDFSSLIINSFTLNIYSDGLFNGGFFVTRIIGIVLLTTMLTLSTSTIELNNGIESVMKPLKFILPVSQIALVISLTLRFVPTLLLETNKILKAQSSRGVDFSEGSLIQKVKQIVTLLIPMFVVSFKRADDLSNAMESRGYVIGAKRSSLTELKFKLSDYLGFSFVMIVLVICIVGSILWW